MIKIEEDAVIEKGFDVDLGEGAMGKVFKVVDVDGVGWDRLAAIDTHALVVVYDGQFLRIEVSL